MKDRESEIIDSDTQIVWVLAEASGFGDASNEEAQDFYDDSIRSTAGIRVGDADTLPAPAFNDSPFKGGRGFWMVLEKSTMTVVHQDTLGPYPSVDEILTTLSAL